MSHVKITRNGMAVDCYGNWEEDSNCIIVGDWANGTEMDEVWAGDGWPHEGMPANWTQVVEHLTAWAKRNGHTIYDLRTECLLMARRLQWVVQVFGERCSESWEISVVHVNNLHGQKSWGWFNDKKLLISHNGGPCHWPLKGFVFDQQVALAHEVAHRLNSGESLD